MREFVTSENENEIHKTLMLTIKFMLMFFMCFIVLSHGFSILFWIRTSYYAAQLMGRSELTTTYTDNENHKIK